MAKKRRPQGFKAQAPAKDQTPTKDATLAPTTGEPPEAVLETTYENPPEYDNPPEEVVVPVWEHSLMDVETEPVSERELKNLLRDWRRGRATKTLRQVLADGYVAVFATVMIVAMLGAGVMRAQVNAAASEAGVGRTLLPWVVMCAAFALATMASRIFGPVVASAAEGFWLMDAPIRRGRLLWKRLVGVIGAAAGIAAALGGLMAALTGYQLDDIWRWAVAMGVGAAGLTALAAGEQTWGRTWLITLIQWFFALVAVGILGVIIVVAAGWFPITLPSLTNTTWVIWVGLTGLVLLVVGGLIAFGRLSMIHRARLVSGGSLVAGMQGAAFAMDFGLMRDILVEREAISRGHVRPTRGGGHGAQALVFREVQRLWRYPKRMMIVVASVIVPYAVAALGFHTFSPFISAIILLIGFVPMLGSMRIMTRTKGLARTLPLSNPQIRKAMVTVPTIFAVGWALATTLAFWGGGAYGKDILQSLITAGLTAAAGLLAAIRWVTAKSANYQMPMMQTGFGAMPPGLMLNMVRGIDIVVLVTGPILLGWSPWISVVIAVIAGVLLSGQYSMEEMQAMQKQMEKEKARTGGTGGTGGSGAAGGRGTGGLFGGGTPPAPVVKQKIAPPKGYRTPPVVK
ncbi:MAG: DUF6297 family protein [Propionibacteriaceae bacterium]|nr:DUF6297 family protein [Propionibacteriaceae bacterium]